MKLLLHIPILHSYPCLFIERKIFTLIKDVNEKFSFPFFSKKKCELKNNYSYNSLINVMERKFHVKFQNDIFRSFNYFFSNIVE